MDIVWIAAIAALWVATVELALGLGKLAKAREQRP